MRALRGHGLRTRPIFLRGLPERSDRQQGRGVFQRVTDVAIEAPLVAELEAVKAARRHNKYVEVVSVKSMLPGYTVSTDLKR